MSEPDKKEEVSKDDIYRVHERLDKHQERIGVLEDLNERRFQQMQVLNMKMDANNEMTASIKKKVDPMSETWRNYIGLVALATSTSRVIITVSLAVIAIAIIVVFVAWVTGRVEFVRIVRDADPAKPSQMNRMATPTNQGVREVLAK